MIETITRPDAFRAAKLHPVHTTDVQNEVARLLNADAGLWPYVPEWHRDHVTNWLHSEKLRDSLRLEAELSFHVSCTLYVNFRWAYDETENLARAMKLTLAADMPYRLFKPEISVSWGGTSRGLEDSAASIELYGAAVALGRRISVSLGALIWEARELPGAVELAAMAAERGVK